MAAKNPTRLPEFFASRTTSAMASTTPSRLCGCSPEPITTVPGQHYAGLHVPMVARVRRGCPDHQTAQAFLQRESPCDSAFSESREVTRPRLDSCKPICKRRGGDRTAGEDTKRGLAGPKTPILPRRTRFQDTSGYGVRRTFNPLVVGSSPTGPTDPTQGAASLLRSATERGIRLSSPIDVCACIRRRRLSASRSGPHQRHS